MEQKNMDKRQARKEALKGSFWGGGGERPNQSEILAVYMHVWSIFLSIYNMSKPLKSEREKSPKQK